MILRAALATWFFASAALAQDGDMLLPWVTESLGGYPANALVLEYTVGEAKWIRLPMAAVAGYNCSVNYGDGGGWKAVTTNTDANASNYFSAGTFTVQITGTYPRINFAGDETKGVANLVRVIQWGEGMGYITTALSDGLRGCSNLVSVPATLFSSFYTNANSTLYQAFNNCFSLTNVSEINGPKGTTTAIFGSFNQARSCKSFPSVSSFTGANSLSLSWYNCRAGTNFPSVAPLTNVTTMTGAWGGNTNAFPIPPLVESSSVLTNSSAAFSGDLRMTGTAPVWWGTNGLPDSVKFPNLANTANMYNGCTNLSNYADIPSGWK